MINFLIFILISIYFISFLYYTYDISNISNISNNDPFILCFRKTRIETMIMNRIEELSKSRDIQFVISFFNYKNDKSIKGLVYIITSKVLYKLFFIKNKLVCNEYYTFNKFISKLNKDPYYSIKNYLSENENSKEKTHHTEFYTWPYYYFTNNYDLESKNLEIFLKKI